MTKRINQTDTQRAALRQMADDGLITVSSRKGPMPSPPWRPAKVKGKPLSQTIIEDREDRARRRDPKKVVKPVKRREVMRYLRGHYAVSTRRASGVIGATRSSAYYKSRRDPLLALRQRMREVAQTRVRFGYRRLRVVLLREGWDVGKERFYRVYTEEGLALRRKRPWRHATAVHREQRRPAAARNDIWTMDFVADELTDGRRFRTLTVLDLFTRECLDIAVGRGLTGQDVVATLERLRFARGLPQRIYCDNGTEFVSAAMDLWAYTNGVILDFSRRGKPTDNAAIESFNGRFRDECLNVHWFESLDDAQARIEAWRQDYNANHPHRALKGLSPNEYARQMMSPAAESHS